MKILVVEDDNLSRDVLSLMFRHAGYEVTEAHDGQEAFEIFEKDPHPIIFTDWMMPHLDGIELCEKVRASQEGSKAYTYVIVGSAHDQGVENYKRAGAAGVDNFLSKPWDTNELLMCLESAKRTLDYIDHIGELQKLIAICKHCKKVNTSEQFWERIEKYVTRETGSDFSHGICPDCAKKVCEEYGLPGGFLEDMGGASS